MRLTFSDERVILAMDFKNGGVRLIVYVDLVIVLNATVDFLLLLSVNRLTGYASKIMRCIIAAVIGGIYSGLCLCSGLFFLQKWYWCIVALGVITIVSFGAKISAIRRGALFVLLSMTLGGIVAGLNIASVIPLILAASAIFLLCTVGIADPVRGIKYVNVELGWKGKIYPLTALVDTGNTLKDPVSGSQVLVVNPQVAFELFQLTRKQLYDPIETMQTAGIYGLRLIPYRTVGSPNGMLLGVSVDSIAVNGQVIGKIIAFSPEDFGNDCCYQALTGGIA